LTFDCRFFDFLSCLENPVALCHINKIHTLLRKSSHTHALHELSNLFKFYVYKKILCLLKSKLFFFISLHSFEMLSDYFISWLYMRVLKLTLGKIFFLQFFLQVSVFHCEAYGRSLLASGRMRLRCPNGQLTLLDSRGLSHAYVATGVRTS